MQRTETDTEMVLRIAREYLEKEPTALGNAVMAFNITNQEIERFKLNPSYRNLQWFVRLHSKKIAVVERRLRVELCEIALKVGAISIGKFIPTSDGLIMKSASSDGFLLADNPITKVVEFVNPLKKDFLNLIRSIA
ncbi:MAG: hypothetical protein WC087_01910 [Candidatus Paceibacterota bacterium]